MASGTIKAVVGRSDIVNNLTTNDSTKVLSAAQGKALKDAADTLNSNIENGHLVAKYLNDTSKTASQLLTADFSNVNLGDIQFYRIRPSDENLYGFIVKHSASYAYGLFAGTNAGDSYSLVNLNGTWTKTKLATDSDIENKTGSCTSSYGTIEYVRTGNVVQLTITCTGIASNAWTTISSNVPKAKKNCAFVGSDQSAGGNVALSITGTSLAFYGRGQYTTCNCSVLYIAE